MAGFGKYNLPQQVPGWVRKLPWDGRVTCPMGIEEKVITDGEIDVCRVEREEWGGMVFRARPFWEKF